MAIIGTPMPINNTFYKLVTFRSGKRTIGRPARSIYQATQEDIANANIAALGALALLAFEFWNASSTNSSGNESSGP